MSMILLAVGILVSLAGLVALGFGIRISDFSVGHSLMIMGTTALSGGLMVIGLALVVDKLARIAAALETRPAVRPVRPAEVPAEQTQRPAAAAPPEPRPLEPQPVGPATVEPLPLEASVPEPQPAEGNSDATLDVSASAIERLRSSIARTPKPEMVADSADVPLSPTAPPPSARNGAGHDAKPVHDAGAQNAGSAADAAKSKRLDFLFKSRANRPPPAEPYETNWPKRSVRDLQNGGRPGPAQRPQTATAPQVDERALPENMAPRVEPARTAAILKSGVVDGMAYTLYADGSIEAQLPHGTVRFGSITELRAHIENNS
jgi:hypothetical protein